MAFYLYIHILLIFSKLKPIFLNTKPGTKVMLKDIPELDLFYPRGEICVKSETMFNGYWKDEEKT